MKICMHRFWLSLALTAGSFIAPLGSNSWAHDLRVPWTGEAISSSTWNCLMDSCFEADRRLDANAQSTCPEENGSSQDELGAFDEVFSRNALSKFTKEMTCWVNDWDRQRPLPDAKAQEQSQLFAALPDSSPAPMPTSAKSQNTSSFVSTCDFDDEHRATIESAEEQTSNVCEPVEFSQDTFSQDATSPCMPSRFAPGIVDEYMAYDLDSRDTHWLSRMQSSTKSWLPLPEVSGDEFQSEATELPQAAATDSVFSAEFDQEFQAQGSAETQYDGQSLKSAAASAADAVDLATCMFTAELCGFEHASYAGELLGDWSQWGVQETLANYLNFGHSLSASNSQLASVEPSLDVFVVYTDTDGATITVPSSLARAWNQTKQDESFGFDEAWLESTSESAPTSFLMDGQQLRRKLLGFVVSRLDSLGLALLQAADQLSNWTEPQIASREDSEIR